MTTLLQAQELIVARNAKFPTRTITDEEVEAAMVIIHEYLIQLGCDHLNKYVDKYLGNHIKLARELYKKWHKLLEQDRYCPTCNQLKVKHEDKELVCSTQK